MGGGGGGAGNGCMQLLGNDLQVGVVKILSIMAVAFDFCAGTCRCDLCSITSGATPPISAPHHSVSGV